MRRIGAYRHRISTHPRPTAMPRSAIDFVRSHKLAVTIFALALGLTIVLSGRALVHFVYLKDPAHRDQPIAAWMTPRYVVMSHQVPPKVLREVLGERDHTRRRATLAEIAASRGQATEELIAQIEAAIAAHRERSQ